MINEQISKTPVKDSAIISDSAILRQAIIAEQDAVNLYEQMARSTSNKKLKEMLLDISQEEKVHIGEFTALLEQIDKEEIPSMKSGKKEAAKKFKEWMESRHYQI